MDTTREECLRKGAGQPLVALGSRNGKLSKYFIIYPLGG